MIAVIAGFGENRGKTASEMHVAPLIWSEMLKMLKMS